MMSLNIVLIVTFEYLAGNSCHYFTPLFLKCKGYMVCVVVHFSQL